MAKSDINLPYFDMLFAAFDQGETNTEKVFGRHVHWGYWEDPQAADGTVDDFAKATERLSKLVIKAAKIKEGTSVLDVGCGFGGTIASLNEQFSPISLVGLNIDERQLQRAREKICPLPGNRIEFICGNACELPFSDNSFDAVLAVECVFHFPSRSEFLKEAHRVLRPGGRLALCEFVISEEARKFSSFSYSYFLEKFITMFYGSCHRCSTEDYFNLAKSIGFNIDFEKDITSETMPTYTSLNTIFRNSRQPTFTAYWSTRLVEAAHRARRILYKVLAFEKPYS
ncbi:methyltransferase domain-containing protein [Leptolyngbya sp. NK1-12]|uniref:Methyltransferase domain-containing protein n=1 Tax=Leptolyngbya sp. NK1-12 TaxID=2547451 RepID=A0AA96WQ47_9CYAN|nr:methyltransferase domain-containing protein [Leptolyngbya sp. NK1-12]